MRRKRARTHAASPKPTMSARFRSFAALLAFAAAFGAPGAAWADKIKHPTAVFAGLDKITGRIITFDVAIDETVQFGALQITPRVCYSRPPTEAPQTDVFAEVDEVREDKTLHRVFTGWMFADSPGMHGVEHPIYDLWLTACKGGTQIIHEAPQVADAPTPEPTPEPGLLAQPTPDPKAAAAAKKRKPKPADPNAPSSAVVITPNLPALPAPAPAPSPTPRATPMRRFFPADDEAPIPPANVGQ
jgi:hypothetical protein